MLPSSRQISSAAEKLLVLEDWHSFGPDYDPTLLAWYRNFKENWPLIKDGYDTRFFRIRGMGTFLGFSVYSSHFHGIVLTIDDAD
jgi:cyclopropane fatty-acyl-phospholipid synthase-like methyltransferase